MLIGKWRGKPKGLAKASPVSQEHGPSQVLDISLLPECDSHWEVTLLHTDNPGGRGQWLPSPAEVTVSHVSCLTACCEGFRICLEDIFI